MGKFGLRRECKGAVTVFVTLLLIPAILVSGTAVDLARIYAARSIVHDANQLAANSVLTQYDALLQDLYGLFGVIQGDDVSLADIVEEDVQTAVFGEDWQDKTMGTFQLFYGADLEPGDPVPAPQMNLGNTAVLRRQIEEYAKIRAPVIIVKDILDRINAFQRVKDDAEVIKTKMEVDNKIEDLEKAYREVYDCIQELNACAGTEQRAFADVNEYLEGIHAQLGDLWQTREDWTTAYDTGNGNRQQGLQQKYTDLLRNVRVLVSGGTVVTDWNEEGLDELGVGQWDGQRVVLGLEQSIQNSVKELQYYRKMLSKLVIKCKQADQEKAELSQKVDQLESKLNEGNCSEQLKDSLMKPQELHNGEAEKSLLEQYRSLLQYDCTAMAGAVKEVDEAQISADILQLGAVYYGDTKTQKPKLEQDDLKKLQDIRAFAIDLNLRNREREQKTEDILEKTAYLSASQYQIQPEGVFKLFQDATAFSATKNPEFYAELEKLFSSQEESKKKSAMKAVTKLFEKAQTLFRGITDYDPEGAWYYRTQQEGSQNAFGLEGDWGKQGEASKKTINALDDDLIHKLGNFGNVVSNKILLLTYCTEMFSNYTTTSDPVVKNMAGIPLGVDVNYFFQSEQEFLLHGNLYDARANLISASEKILLVRFVFNYIASFQISEVNAVVRGIQAALSASGPFGFIIAELARGAIAMAESVIDVGTLRSGHKVTLLKNDEDWCLSVKNMLDEASGTVLDISDQVDFTLGLQHTDHVREPALSYTDYIRLFLLLEHEDILAGRTATLISLNVTNKKEGIGQLSSREEREAAMAQATCMDLADAYTGFSLTTTVNLRMLFLSMPFAQKGLNGIVPPKTLPVSVTDYRGY